MQKYENPNAVKLVRVSGKGRDHGMDSQRTYNAQTVAAKGLQVLKTTEYSDISGDAVMFTPEMQELQAFLRTPAMKNGHLVARELSRLLRPNWNEYPLLQVFDDQRITIHLPSHELQLWTSQGRLLASVMCAVAYEEARTIRDRLMGGREEARKLGHPAAGRVTIPTGFTFDWTTEEWGVDPEYMPNLLEIVRMIVDEGETNLKFIINQLHFCMRPPKGRTPKLATHTSLRRLLQNRMLIGERVIDQKADLEIPTTQLWRVGKDGNNHRRQRPMIPREVPIIVQVMPPVISRERFERLQAILKAKSDKHHQNHMLHQDRPRCAYHGLIFCGDCGNPLYTAFNDQYAYYRCRDHFKRKGGTGKCPSHAMKASALDAEMDRVFSTEFTRTYFLAKLIKEQDGRDNRKAITQRRNQVDARMTALSAKRERIIEAQLDGTITKDDRDRRLKTVNDEIDSNRKALAELVETPLPTQATWMELIRPFTRGFSGRPVDEKRRLVASRFQQIKVRDGRVVSMYLLTGEAKAVPARPEENCYTCGRILGQDDLDYNDYCEVDFHGRFCRACLDRTPRERTQKRPQRQGSGRTASEVAGLIQQVRSVSDSYQRLSPQRTQRITAGHPRLIHVLLVDALH